MTYKEAVAKKEEIGDTFDVGLGGPFKVTIAPFDKFNIEAYLYDIYGGKKPENLKQYFSDGKYRVVAYKFTSLSVVTIHYF